MGCSREELHTSIGIPFFLFCYRCCIRCWDHVSWKHIAALAGDLRWQAVKGHQTINADCLSHQICSPPLVSHCRFSGGTTVPIVPYTLMHPLVSFGLSLTARRHISSQNSLQASVCVFSDRMMAHQQRWTEKKLTERSKWVDEWRDRQKDRRLIDRWINKSNDSYMNRQVDR